MNKREVRWERMFPDELERAFEECPLVYFPYGLCEPHCALGLDGLKAHAVARRAAQEGGGIVAPPDYRHLGIRHCRSGHYRRGRQVSAVADKKGPALPVPGLFLRRGRCYFAAPTVLLPPVFPSSTFRPA